MVKVSESPLTTLNKKVEGSYEKMKQLASPQFTVGGKNVDYSHLSFELYLNGKQIGHVFYNANTEQVRITGNPDILMAFATRLEKNGYTDVGIWTD